MQLVSKSIKSPKEKYLNVAYLQIECNKSTVIVLYFQVYFNFGTLEKTGLQSHELLNLCSTSALKSNKLLKINGKFLKGLTSRRCYIKMCYQIFPTDFDGKVKVQ